MQGSLTCKHDEQPRLGGSQGVPCKSLTGSWPWQTRPSADELAGGRAGLGCRRGGERGGEGGELSQGPLSPVGDGADAGVTGPRARRRARLLEAAGA